METAATVYDAEYRPLQNDSNLEGRRHQQGQALDFDDPIHMMTITASMAMDPMTDS
jgi:hypothetical protein